MNVFLEVMSAESLSFRKAFHLELSEAAFLVPATPVDDININSMDKTEKTPLW